MIAPSARISSNGFYELTALRAELRRRAVLSEATQPRLDALLDLVALGTVADVVRLDANNRILVAEGLRVSGDRVYFVPQVVDAYVDEMRRQAMTMKNNQYGEYLLRLRSRLETRSSSSRAKTCPCPH